MSGMSKNLTENLYSRAKKIIPGGTQLVSKRPELFAPGQWPAYFNKAKGCEVWDMDDRHYYDMASGGIGTCLLGFCDPDVTLAVKKRIDDGSMCTLNPPEEVELAETLCDIHPWAERVRFTRSGGEASAVAVRIARATTGRSIVVICGYHGWHDFYLSANLGEDDSLQGHLLPGLEPAGVPVELRGTSYTFNYNNVEEFMAVMERCGDKTACVMMEPCRHHDPNPGFLEMVREETRKRGIVLIFDEITIGWRLTYGGSHLKLGVNPDMAVYAKALGNGHPIGAVIGTEASMEGAHRSFISSTYWTESVGPAAALAALKKMRQVNAHEHAAKTGEIVSAYWKSYAHKYHLPVVVGDGYPCLAQFNFDHEQSSELKTLYIQLMLERGFLASTYFFPTTAHDKNVVERYGLAIDGVFGIIAHSLTVGNVSSLLKGPAAHSGFRRLN